MCGRFGLEASWQELFDYLDLVGSRQLGESMPPRYNIAPTQPIVTVSIGVGGSREGQLVRWGLVPSWVKDPKDFSLLVNARAETAIDKPTFRNAMRHRRVLIPASGFYEWQRYGKGEPSQPYWVRPRDGGMVCFGGLVETWCDPNGSEIDTGCIISTAANESFAPIHHRLPLVIQPDDFDRWLDCRTQEPRDLVDLMTPVDDEYFECIPVSTDVNKVANTGRYLQNAIEIKSPAKTKPRENEQYSMF